MQYKVIEEGSATSLTEKVNEALAEGWLPVGSHQVQTRHVQNRFSGTQHMDSRYSLEYSQTMIKHD